MSKASLFPLSSFARIALGAAVVSLGGLPSFAAGTPSTMAPDPGFHARTWTTDHGLPHNIVSRIVQDATGFMWFATVGGLARFDGGSFREWPLPAEHRPLGFNIRGLAEETPGTLVVLSASGGVLRFAHARWSLHPADAELTKVGASPIDLHVDAQHRVWFVTGDDRLLRWSPEGEMRVLGPYGGLASRARRGLFASDDSGNLWIATGTLRVMSRDGELREHALPHGVVRAVAPARNGGVWVWTDQRLLLMKDGRILTGLELPTEHDFGGVRHLFEDSDGALWISTTRSGLFCYTKGRVVRVARYVSVWFVMEDREGNIWVATDGHGVGQVREKSYRLYNSSSGLPFDGVSSIAEDPSGRIWLANRGGGLVAIEPDGSIARSALRGVRSYANAVCADEVGRLWFGGGRNGLQRWAPGAAEKQERMPAPRADLHVLYRARNGDMWFAGGGGSVGYYRDGRVRTLTELDGFLREDISAIAEDKHGGIWLGGRRGELLRWNGRAIERFGAAQGFPTQLIHTIWVDAENRLWIGTAQGLVIKDGEQFHRLTEADGLGDDIIQQVLEGNQGRLWFATRRGLFHANKAVLLDVARGKRRRVDSHRIGPNQGLVGLSPTANYQPAACKASDGRLWFATAQGAIVVNPRQLPRDLPLPTVLVDEVRVDGEPRSIEAARRMPSGRHRLEIRLAALAYTSPEEVVLRHLLEGVDTRWVDTGTDRTADYTNLPPGDYRLRVTARNSAGVWNTTGAMWAFQIVPAWWETFGFRFSVAVLAVLLIAWLARIVAQRRMRRRLRRLEQEHALEKERLRIARDLHDDLGAGLTEVGLLADRLVETAPVALGPQLSGLAWRTRRLATDLSGIVWTMNASNSTIDRLAAFLGRYAARLFRTTTTRCIVTGVERIPAILLPPGPQHQLLAAAKEALNNILKHARASEARVDMAYADAVFELRIADDGVGFAERPELNHEGNGLRNMRARMAEVGGRFGVTTQPGRGTEILLQVPCAARAESP